MRGFRTALRAAAAAAAVWGAVHVVFLLPGSPYMSPGRATYEDYPEIGAALIHAVEAVPGHVLTRMPASGIAAYFLARVQESGIGLAADAVPFLIQALLVLLLGALLASPWLGVVSLALFEGLLIFDGSPGMSGNQAVYSCFVLSAACLLVHESRRPEPRRTALLAAALGAGLMARTPLLFFPALLLLWEARRPGIPKGRDPLRAAVLLAGPLVFLIPTLILNKILIGQWNAVEAGTSDNNIITGAAGMVATMAGDWSLVVDDPPALGRTGAALSWALSEISRHPVRYAVSVVRRLAFVFSLHPFAFLLAGASLWSVRGRRAFERLGLLMAYFILVHCLMSVRATYFTPLVPLAAVAGAAGPYFLFRRAGFLAGGRALLFRRRGAAAAALLPCLIAALAARYALADALRALGRPPGLDDAFDEAVRRSPGDAWLRAARARRRLADGRIDGAVEDYAASLRAAPDAPGPRLELAWAYGLKGFGRELANFRPGRSAADFGTDAFDYLLVKRDLGIALSELRAGRREAARSRLRSSWVRWKENCNDVHGPRTPLGREALAAIRGGEGQPFLANAAARWRHLLGPAEISDLAGLLLELSPDSARLRLMGAEAAYAAGRPDAARAFLKDLRAGDLHKRDIESAAELKRRGLPAAGVSAAGVPFQNKPGGGLPAAGVSAAGVPLQNKPGGGLGVNSGTGAAAWVEWAMASQRKGDRGKAMRYLGRALALDPGREALVGASRVYSELGEHARSEEVLARLLERFPGDPELLAARAAAAAGAGAPERARDLLGKALSKSPPAESSLRIALVYQQLRDYAAAVAVLDPLARDPAFGPRALRDRGICEFLAGSPAKAASDLEAALARDPGLLSAYPTLGAVYVSMGRSADARALYERGLTVPASDDERRHRGRIRESLAALVIGR